MSLDVTLFRLVNGLAGQNGMIDSVARLFVNEYFVTAVMALVFLVIWFTPGEPAQRLHRQRGLFVTAFSILLANTILKGINLLYFRPRPSTALDNVTMCFYEPWDSSWPSNPATFAFAMATGVYFTHRGAGIVTYILATIFVLSRVYCGVHYPLDILSGALLGAVTAVVVVRKSRLLNPVWDFLVGLGRRLYLA